MTSAPRGTWRYQRPVTGRGVTGALVGLGSHRRLKRRDDSTQLLEVTPGDYVDRLGIVQRRHGASQPLGDVIGIDNRREPVDEVGQLRQAGGLTGPRPLAVSHPRPHVRRRAPVALARTASSMP